MSVSIPPKELKRLKTFLGVLGSDQDGEVLSAKHQISKLLTSHGLKMVDLPTVLGDGNAGSKASEEGGVALYRARWLDAVKLADQEHKIRNYFEDLYHRVTEKHAYLDSRYDALLKEFEDESEQLSSHRHELYSVRDANKKLKAAHERSKATIKALKTDLKRLQAEYEKVQQPVETPKRQAKRHQDSAQQASFGF